MTASVIATAAPQSLAADAPATAIIVQGQCAAVALGDGRVRLVDLRAGDAATAAVEDMPAHGGAVLSLAADPAGRGFLSGGDDGRLVRLRPGAAPVEIAFFPGRWIETVVAEPGAATYAFVVGRQLHVRAARDDAPLAVLDHPTTVAGVAFHPKGKRIAAGHYKGVSLWWANGNPQTPTRLEWNGSHVAVTWSSNGKYIVTGTQENTLHGWRLVDRADLQMHGYPAKPRSFAWTPSGNWLATSGAETIVCWPFAGDGPMGKEPREIGWSDSLLVTRVAAHPKREIIAGGFANGAILLADIASRDEVTARSAGGSAVTALAWGASGTQLLFGTEAGAIGVIGAR